MHHLHQLRVREFIEELAIEVVKILALGEVFQRQRNRNVFFLLIVIVFAVELYLFQPSTLERQFDLFLLIAYVFKHIEQKFAHCFYPRVEIDTLAIRRNKYYFVPCLVTFFVFLFLRLFFGFLLSLFEIHILVIEFGDSKFTREDLWLQVYLASCLDRSDAALGLRLALWRVRKRGCDLCKCVQVTRFLGKGLSHDLLEVLSMYIEISISFCHFLWVLDLRRWLWLSSGRRGLPWLVRRFH